MNPPSSPTRVRDIMTGETSSIKEFHVNLSTPILPNIRGEPTREGLIDLHRLVGGNTEFVLSNLGGGWYGHLALTMTRKEYAEQTVFAFVPPHNPDN